MKTQQDSCASFVLCATVLVWALGTGSRGETLYVDSGQSIQAAVDAAYDGDEIEVAPGSYHESINLLGKAVRLYSSGGADVTVIDGTGHYHVVQCVNGEDTGTVLEGFTITGGSASGPAEADKRGGGMLNSSSSPAVINCVFRANSALSQGGGMYNDHSSPTLTGCTFISNGTLPGVNGKSGGGWESGGDGGEGTGSGSGGGMYNYLSDPNVVGCTFEDNETGDAGDGGDGADGVITQGSGGNGAASGHGGGVYNDQSNARFADCTFTGNRTGMGGTGGYGLFDPGRPGPSGCGAGVYNVDCSPLFTRCEFTGNQTGRGAKEGAISNGARSENGGNGAGMHNLRASVVVVDCGFTGNVTGVGGVNARHDGSAGHGGNGAGICSVESSLTITRCTFSANQTGKGGDCTKTSSGGSGGYSGNGGSGAGIASYNCTSAINRCTFRSNRTGDGGRAGSAYTGVDSSFNGTSGGNGGSGAGIFNWGGSATMIGCRFLENVSGSGASGGNGGDSVLAGGGNGGNGGNGGLGAIFNGNGCVAAVSNCAFLRNVAGSRGIRGVSGCGLLGCGNNGTSGAEGTSGIANANASAAMINCTLYDNHGAGVLWNQSGNSTLANCVLWDNALPEVVIASGSLAVTYSDVKDGTGHSWFGQGCIEADPMIVDTEGRIPPYSPCFGAGNNDTLGLSEQDIDGNPRIIGAHVDMGAYECMTLPVQNVTTASRYEKIQLAIDDANQNDQICVMPGHYQETIDFKGKAVHLFSLDGPESTTIDGSGNYHVVKCVSGEDNSTILDGFTITGGNASGGLAENFDDGNYNGWLIFDQGNRGGPSVWSATSSQMVQSSNLHTYPYDSPVLRGTFALWKFGAAWKDYSVEARIKSADDDAIGIMFRYQDENNYYRFCWGGTHRPYITLGKMINNSYTILSEKSESGIYPHNWCTLRISASGPVLQVYINDQLQLSANDSALEVGSIALYCWGNAGAYYDDISVLVAGSDTFDTFGGGMYNENSNPTVTNCIFADNWALEGGGGMANLYASTLTVSNCVFRSNSVAPDEWICGGAVFNAGYGGISLTNCTFNANTAAWGGAAIGNFMGGRATVTNCVLWGNIGNGDPASDEIYGTGNLTISYSNVEGAAGQSWFSETGGNYDDDPLFVDAAAGNLRLLPSGCLDTGTNTAPGLPATDIDGYPRIIDGDCFPFPQVDRGAYEFNYADKGDFNYNCEIDAGDLVLLAESWMTHPGDPGWTHTRDISNPRDKVIDLEDMAVMAERWLLWLAW